MRRETCTTMDMSDLATDQKILDLAHAHCAISQEAIAFTHWPQLPAEEPPLASPSLV